MAMRIRVLRVTFRDAMVTARSLETSRERATIAHAVRRGEAILRQIRADAGPESYDELDGLAGEIRAAGHAADRN
jgi:hypothetical protein